jgi:cardiolipin synthase
MSMKWKGGNRVQLLENGEEFFPAVFEAIDAARHEVILETFILFQDKVGLALQTRLLAAAQRGVQVDVTVDGYGSPDLTTDFVGALASAGVRLHVFDPQRRLFGRLRTNVFRRMHRKIVIVDGAVAFVGGINFSADHLLDYGPAAKQDYAVQIEGPVVDDIHRFAGEAIAPASGPRWRRRRRAMPVPSIPQVDAGSADVLFVVRDNHAHRDDIEHHYRLALRAARREVIIAVAYFFPGYRLLKEMRRAAERGVHVCLVLQGQPDMPIVKVAARMLYDRLLRAGVHIFEYCRRPLHGKVALADDEWATVGSSNLDPLSLALNLEANVMIHDRGFNQQLRARLQELMHDDCSEIDAQRMRPSWWHVAASSVAFHVLRHFPTWAGWLPAHQPRLAPASAYATVARAARARRLAHWRHGLATLFFGIVAVALMVLARRIEWDEVWDALAAMPAPLLWQAAALAAMSHALYSSYDLLGRAWTHQKLPTAQVVAVNFVSYAFNLNLGALIGAFAFRYRLYSRLGLDNNVITRVVGLSLVTNWIGYLLLAGTVFAMGGVTLPSGWEMSFNALRVLGVAMFASALGYLLLCARSRRREWQVRGHVIALPPWSIAWRQLAVSCANWALIGALLTVLLEYRVGYPSVLGTFLVAALAGVITHIPAGLGVIEAVFIALLGAQVPQGTLLAALLAYRALHYLLPLLAASLVALRLETRARAPRNSSARSKA